MKGWEKARERNESNMKLIFKDMLLPLFNPVMLRFKLMYKLIPSCYEESRRNISKVTELGIVTI